MKKQRQDEGLERHPQRDPLRQRPGIRNNTLRTICNWNTNTHQGLEEEQLQGKAERIRVIFALQNLRFYRC